MTRPHRFLIGGGTGFIGQALCNFLKTKKVEHVVISRMPGPNRLTWHDIEDSGLPNGITAVVNLAGQNVLDATQRWSPGFKQNVYNSRINTSLALANAITKSIVRPSVFIGITGVSLYPCDDKSAPFSESADGLKPFDYMSKLCRDWEDALTISAQTGCRQVIIRTGVVLGREGGMIKQIILPYWLGVGGPIWPGTQALPWIHINDLVELIWFCANHQDLSGVINGVAPQMITNAEFSKEFAAALSRPALIPVPESVLNMLFHKDRAVLLTKGPKVIPERAQKLGFEYKYPDIRSACKNVAKIF